MRHRGCVLAIVAVVGSVVVAGAQGAPDEQSLKAAHETIVSSVTSANLTVLQSMVHPRATGFFKDSQQLVQLGDGVSAATILPTLITDLGRFVTVPTNTAYRVVGAVGMVNLTAILQAKKGEKQPDRFVRGTYIYLWDGGNWKLISWHGSDTPLQKGK